MIIKPLFLLLVGIISYNSQPVNQQTQVFYTGGGCAEIPKLGSPILMVANAHKYIEDALNIKNSYTQAKYIYFNQVQSVKDPGQTTYRLVFSITDYYGTKFAGIELMSFPFGIGNVKINKFIFTSDFNKIKMTIDPNATNNNAYSCGDLKFVYSSYGNNNYNQLGYPFPGDNRNSVGLNILNELNSSVNKPVNAKNCVTINFLETVDFFGVNGTTTPVDLLNCLPNKNGVVTLLLGCNGNTLSSIQLVFNNINNDGTQTSQFVGNVNTPASAITSIDIGGANRISFTSTTSPLSLKIQTLDTNNQVLTNYQCGTGVTNPRNVIVSANNFLGFTNIYANGSIQSFEITQYAK